MVSSKLNLNVIYKESKTIDPEDRGLESSLYEIDLFEKQVVITLGKLKYTYANKHILYIPIYLVNPDNTIDSQIGVYEFDNNNAMIIKDEEGDIDITYMTDPILYEFAESIVKQTKSNVIEYLTKWEKPETDIVSTIAESIAIDTVIGDDEDDEDDNIMRLKIQKQSKTKQMEKAIELIDEGIFTTNTKQLQPIVLGQETEKEADEIQDQYKESSKNTWIQKFMKNTNYEIHEVESNGDCFFAVVRDAFKQIGQITTVDKLRAILASEITEEIFQEYRTVFNAFNNMIKNIDSECKSIKTVLITLQKRMENSKKITDQKEIKIEVENKTNRFYELQEERKQAKINIASSVGDISKITTFQEFQEYIQTSNYWADTWSIMTLERVLNMKMIIFSEEAYQENSINSVLTCGEVDNKIQVGSKISPNYYIMTSFSGNHYRLISYKTKKILKFSEIPYHIKMMIMNRCYETNAGIYYLIEDFRNFKIKLGIDPNIGEPLKEDEHIIDLYEPDTVFMFHAKSETTAKPGKGSGEKITNEKIGSFIHLSKMNEWRRAIDDTWTNAPFKIDGHMYASVTHYYQGAKFKQGNPDFSLLFSLDSKNKISEDVVLARAAGGKTGKLKTDILRPKQVLIDPDFYPIRNIQERSKALRAKFTQHAELARILMETKKAKLVHYIAKNPPEIDLELMKLRDELIRASMK